VNKSVSFFLTYLKLLNGSVSWFPQKYQAVKSISTLNEEDILKSLASNQQIRMIFEGSS